MNWNPSYSYAHIPTGMSIYPSYWNVLAKPVPEEQGRADFHDVHIWNLRATGAQTAFEVSAYPEKRLDNFTFNNLQIEARTAGRIVDASHWIFSKVSLKTEDGTVVLLSDDNGVQGIPARVASPAPSASTSSSHPQDR